MLIPYQALNVARFASDDPSRYQLVGVHVQRDANGKPSLEATDGRVLCRTTWAEDPHEEMPEVSGTRAPAPIPGFSTLIPASAFSGAAKNPMFKRPWRPILRNLVLDESAANGTVPLWSTNLEAVSRSDVRSMEGQYPNLEKAFVPETSEGIALSVDLGLLRDFCDALLKIHPPEREDKHSPARTMANIRVTSPDRPIEFKVTSKSTGISSTALLMVCEKETK